MLAAGVAAGIDLAAYLAAGLMAAFGAAMLAAMQRGRSGAPCACFGARSTVGWPRSLVTWCSRSRSSRFRCSPRASYDHEWLGLGLGVALLACAGLAIAVLALRARWGCRLRLRPAAALEIPEGGAAGRLAHRSDRPLRAWPRVRAGARGLHLRRLPRVPRARAGDRVARPRPRARGRGVRGDFEARRVAGARDPGSPYAIALDLDGTVLAKGTFNSLAQLESVLATAERRRAERGTVKAWVSDAFERLAANTSRRGFLSRVGGALVAATAGGTVGKLIEPGEADAYHFCGHIFTTGSCPTRPGSPNRRRRLSAAAPRRTAGRQHRPVDQRTRRADPRQR